MIRIRWLPKVKKWTAYITYHGYDLQAYGDTAMNALTNLISNREHLKNIEYEILIGAKFEGDIW